MKQRFVRPIVPDRQLEVPALVSQRRAGADHNGQSLVTRNHDVIMRWAEERGARPATVSGTEKGDTLGVLRFMFDDSDRLEEVSWDEWFKTFDERNLVMIFQEKLKNGNQSNFFRFDNPEREDA